MINKYYTPNISEFHVGFIYQEEKKQGVQDNPYYEWEDTVIYNDFSTSQNWGGSITDLLYLLENDKIRVKYLDKEDIESLGFIENIKDQYYLYSDTLERDITLFIDDDRFIQIINEQNEIEYFLFQGTIKNKSELKIILKQLGIYE